MKAWLAMISDLNQSEWLDALVFLTEIRTAHARFVAEELDLTLQRTRARIEQSMQRIAKTDKLLEVISDSLLGEEDLLRNPAA